MTPDELEAHIRDCGAHMQAAWSLFAETGWYEDRCDAIFWRKKMEDAIKARTPETVARMEEQRGLA